MSISIIIPAYNEQGHIGKVIQHVRQHGDARHIAEIIVVDGGSEDDTINESNKHGAKVVHAPKGRAKQMNSGAKEATAPILYFLHADSFPPAGFTSHILDAVAKGYGSGCYSLAFDHDHWFLKANCWFSRFDVNAVRFGDQSLFVKKEAFIQSGGFREDLLMMEDQEIIHRIKQHSKFKVLKGAVTTSARKYLDNGIYRMQGIFYLIWTLYYLRYSQEKLLLLHRKLIKRHKL